MRTRKIDAQGNVVFGQGLQSYAIDNPEAVRLAILTRLEMGEGEWFLDTDDGTPWSSQVLGKHTQSTRDPALRARILETPGVDEIETFQSYFDAPSRTYSVRATVTTVYGPVVIERSL